MNSESSSAPETNPDYQRIAEVIEYLRLHRQEQPGLAEIAALLGQSEAHAQKLFSRWAGISPKRFLQFLTVEYAKQRMADTGDLLSLSLDSGLSGPGRLHDLFVTMEAMSPGEYKRAGEGLTIACAVGMTPFGQALIATTERGICHLAFVEPGTERQALTRLQAQWPQARLRTDPQAGQALLDRLFDLSRARDERPLSLWVGGSNFQIQVWRALLQIPFAGILNYGQLASLLGQPKAARAVGSAVARNPVAYLIPCHRVLLQSGESGQYHWGATRKQAILTWEAGRASH